MFFLLCPGLGVAVSVTVPSVRSISFLHSTLAEHTVFCLARFLSAHGSVDTRFPFSIRSPPGGSRWAETGEGVKADEDSESGVCLCRSHGPQGCLKRSHNLGPVSADQSRAIWDRPRLLAHVEAGTAPTISASNQEYRENTGICKILHCSGTLESGRSAAWATSARTCGLLARKSACLRLTSPSAVALSRGRSAGSSAGYVIHRSRRWKSSPRPSRCRPAGCSTRRVESV